MTTWIGSPVRNKPIHLLFFSLPNCIWLFCPFILSQLIFITLTAPKLYQMNAMVFLIDFFFFYSLFDIYIYRWLWWICCYFSFFLICAILFYFYWLIFHRHFTTFEKKKCLKKCRATNNIHFTHIKMFTLSFNILYSNH